MLRRLFLFGLATLSLFASAPHAGTGNDARVLVFGGTGRLGSDIAIELVRSGYNVTVFARASSDRERLAGVPVKFVIGDVTNIATIDDALSNAHFDAIVDALGRGSANVDFYEVSASNIASGAARHNISQIVLHGSVGAGESAKQVEYSSLSAGMQRLMAAKTAGEVAVMNSGVKFTIIRNSHLVAYGTNESGNARLYEDQSLSGSATRQGLARLTAGCILNTDCYDKIYHAVDKTFNKRE